MEKRCRLPNLVRHVSIQQDYIRGISTYGRVPKRLRRSHRNLYPGPESGAKVLARLVEYSEYLRSTVEDTAEIPGRGQTLSTTSI